MAEKKFYWLKLKKDYFDSPKMKKLRRIAGGDTYMVIYLKMQLLSIENEGIIVFEGIEDSFDKELALKLDEDLENVRVVLSFLDSQGMIEKNDNEFLLVEVTKNIGNESESAERVRRFRERQKEKVLQCNGDVTELKRNSISNSNSNSNNNINNLNNTKTKNVEKKRGVDDYDFAEEVKESILLWLQYKKEKGQTYKPTGLQTLLDKLKKQCDTEGNQSVIDDINFSMTQNYQGIFKNKSNNYKNDSQKQNKGVYTAEQIARMKKREAQHGLQTTRR